MALAGWHLEPGAAGTSTVAIDGENTHRGQGSLKLTAPAAPSSVISESFVPNVQSRLDIEVYFRASAPGAKVRVWIEGESGGQPYVRRTELKVSTAWESRTVRASDIPARGLDSARVRFELMTPGVLWIDDLHVRGEKTSTLGENQCATTCCWRLCRLIANNVTPTSLGLRGRTGSASPPRRRAVGWLEPTSPPARGPMGVPSDRRVRLASALPPRRQAQVRSETAGHAPQGEKVAKPAISVEPPGTGESCLSTANARRESTAT